MNLKLPYLGLEDYTFLLASNSPRRKQFFEEMNLPFQVVKNEVEEDFPSHLKEKEITEFIVSKKSDLFQQKLEEKEVLITADTMVWVNNQAVGKPKDEKEAFLLLKMISDNRHKVITSVCLRTKDEKRIFSDETYVTFRELSLPEMDFYIKNYQPYDKAGGYGIQEWIGIIGITKIEGSYPNVVGFPTEKFLNELKIFLKLIDFR